MQKKRLSDLEHTWVLWILNYIRTYFYCKYEQDCYEKELNIITAAKFY